MSIAFVAASADSTDQLSLDVAKPSGLAENDVMVAVVAAGRYNALPTITAPSGWTYIGDEYTKDTGNARRRHRVYWKRAGDSEGATYTWSVDGSANIYTCVNVSISAYRGCRTDESPIDQIVSLDYTTSDKLIRAGSLTPGAKDVYVVILASSKSSPTNVNASAPSGYTERTEEYGGGSSCPTLTTISDVLYESLTATGTKDTTMSGISAANQTEKRAWHVSLRPAAVAPGDPTISEPDAAENFTPGTTVDLTASATNDGYKVAYKWAYDAGAGSVDIDTTGYVSSGTSETLEWDTSGLAVGTYQLSCWAVDVETDNLSDAATVTVTISWVIIDAPTDESNQVAGVLSLVGRGYLPDAGDVLLRWEIDTNATPDDESEDYQTVDTEAGDQGDSLRASITIGLGTWYIRACAVDDEDAESDWSPIVTVYVRERLRLLAGSEVKKSILAARNKIYARVKGTAIVESATYDEAGDPLRYSATRREDSVIMPAGDSTAAQAVATSTVARRRQEQEYYSGLQVSLEDGLKLQRGELVGVQIDRMNVNTTLPIRELVFDIGAGVCHVTVGSWAAPQADLDTLVSIAERVDRIERENA